MRLILNWSLSNGIRRLGNKKQFFFGSSLASPLALPLLLFSSSFSWLNSAARERFAPVWHCRTATALVLHPVYALWSLWSLCDQPQRKLARAVAKFARFLAIIYSAAGGIHGVHCMQRGGIIIKAIFTMRDWMQPTARRNGQRGICTRQSGWYDLERERAKLWVLHFRAVTANEPVHGMQF